MGPRPVTAHTQALREALPEEFLREKKYEIGGLVAQGGMGAILDAHEADDRPHRGDEGDARERLARRSRAVSSRRRRSPAQLEHPNIVPVHELGVDEHDQVFYTMKFVRGITLNKVLELLARRHPGHGRRSIR